MCSIASDCTELSSPAGTNKAHLCLSLLQACSLAGELAQESYVTKADQQHINTLAWYAWHVQGA